MTDVPLKIVSAKLSPHHMRVMFTLEGTEDSLQGVVDWAVETWGTGECQSFYRPGALTSKRGRKMRIFRYSRIKAHYPHGKWYPTMVSLGVTKPPIHHTMEVAVWGKDQSALFKLRWA